MPSETGTGRNGKVFFAATGVTNGGLLKGGQYFSGGAKTHFPTMRAKIRTVRFIETYHYFNRNPLL